MNPHTPIRWFVYDESGTIVRTGRCSACVVEEQHVESGERLVPLRADVPTPDPSLYRVDLTDPEQPRIVAKESQDAI